MVVVHHGGESRGRAAGMFWDRFVGSDRLENVIPEEMDFFAGLSYAMT